jgi:hypothetical protein
MVKYSDSCTAKVFGERATSSVCITSHSGDTNSERLLGPTTTCLSSSCRSFEIFPQSLQYEREHDYGCEQDETGHVHLPSAPFLKRELNCLCVPLCQLVTPEWVCPIHMVLIANLLVVFC